jgi:hypothetical protein
MKTKETPQQEPQVPPPGVFRKKSWDLLDYKGFDFLESDKEAAIVRRERS